MTMHNSHDPLTVLAGGEHPVQAGPGLRGPDCARAWKPPSPCRKELS